MILSELLATAIQLILFIIVPFLWWIFTARKTKAFPAWIGLMPPKVEKPYKLTVTLVLTCAVLLVPGLSMMLAFEDKSMLATARFAQAGVPGVVAGLCYAFIQTGLAEEVLFRGFLCKRLSNRLGFFVGNTIQSALFGLLHGLFLLVGLSLPMGLAIIIFSFAAGWLMGYVNEKLAGGSIVPSWMVHGAVNTVSVAVFLFGLITP